MIKFYIFSIGLAVVLWAVNYVLSALDYPPEYKKESTAVEPEIPAQRAILNEANTKEAS